MLTVVIARHNEDIAWVSKLENVNIFIITKSAVGQNIGLDPASHLWFICEHYHSLRGQYLFCQAFPFDHCPDFLSCYGTRRTYGPEIYYPDCHLDPACIEMSGILSRIEPVLLGNNGLRFSHGQQFQVSAEEIRKRSLRFWQHAHKLTQKLNRAAYTIEAIWPCLIPELKEAFQK